MSRIPKVVVTCKKHQTTKTYQNKTSIEKKLYAMQKTKHIQDVSVYVH